VLTDVGPEGKSILLSSGKMQTETKTVLYVMTTIVMIVASSFSALGYLANRAVVDKAGPVLAHAPDVRSVQHRADLLLIATVGFWMVASVVFAGVIPHRPERGARPYVTSTALVAVAVVVTVTLLRYTADLLKLF
jgi:hypothetical protein